ncbi:MAG: rhamnulokinase [Armatimonadetes bacterium]|nr:rhamnulokinase [Akkermansiaceae bacterium]
MSTPETREKIRIAVDLGASSGRVIAGIVSGGKLSLREIHRFDNPAIELPSGLYWNILGLYHEIIIGLKKSIELYGREIESIGIDTWACDFGFFDTSGELIGMPHQYRDPRSEGMAEKMHDIVPEAEIYRQTGIKTNFYNSSLHLLSLELKQSLALKEASALLFIPDILAYWLTGVKAVERTNASTSQLLDPQTGDWSFNLIEKLGFPRRIFGKIISPGTILGNLRPELEAIIGRSDIPFVATACHDTAAAVAGIPLSEPETLWLSSGTWSIMGVEIETPITTREALEYGFCNELGVNNTVRFLKNIAGLWLIQECKREWDREGKNHSFAELAAIAADAEPFFAFIDPDDPIFASPGNMPGKIRDFCQNTKQRIPSSIGQILGVATDSLALKYRLVFERIQTLTGKKFTRLHVGGGGIQNELLCQATANALAIEVLAGPVEATSCGNIITQMIATGDLPTLSAGRQLIKDSFVFKTYQPIDNASRNDAYERFLLMLDRRM